MKNDLNITWEYCQHGILKSNYCPQCQNQLNDFMTSAREVHAAPTRIPIRRGCKAQGGCFCTGRCQDIIGYRDPLFPGER